MSTRAKASTSKEPNNNASATTLSADQLRRKAKYQLLGSAVLVVLGVALFAVLLDSPPRPNTNQVSILIPARDSLAPLALPASLPVATAASVPTVAGTAPVIAASSSPSPAPAANVIPNVKPTPSTSAAAAPASAAGVAASAPQVKATETAASATPEASRYVVQVGAFTDAQKIRDVRAKLERAGFKTYAQVVQTNDGQRTRVRVGPFATKAEAEKAATKIKSLDLPTVLLTL